MSLSLLHVVTPFALFTAALGQAIIPTECNQAIKAFSQKIECFSSQEVANAVLASFLSLSNFSNPLAVLSNFTYQRALTTFYNNFCTSQKCVNSYVEALQVCFESLQVNF